MSTGRLVAIALIGFACAACSARAAAAPGGSAGPVVDWQRYLGTWYELARYDHRFERGLHAVTATYGMRDDGRISVLNAGRKGGPGGPASTAEGVARIVGANELSVTFFWPFSGAYRVLALADDYRWAVVASHGDGYLWYLHRAAQAPPEDWAAMAAAAQAKGFDTGKLIIVEH